MRRWLTSRTARCTAWVAMLALTIEMLPVNAIADTVQNVRKKHEMAQKAKQPDVRMLSVKDMAGIRGSGEYRNRYLCGTMPWQRSFHDVNLCTGNLFKSFTDIQVAPAKGAGLVLQRTYNSNDDRVGAFGIGWTHAYDIRTEESPDEMNKVDKTDFFGGKHKFNRDADGLYTPPVYLHCALQSEYEGILENGPQSVSSDLEESVDGTIKFYERDGNERICKYIQDRYGNRTTLEYQSFSMPGGGTKKLVTSVKDPSNRYLYFHWFNTGIGSQPWRIRQVDGPINPDTGNPIYSVTYQYNGEGNLSEVRLDPTMLYTSDESLYDVTGLSANVTSLNSNPLDRVTTYGYTSHSGETGLLSSVTSVIKKSPSEVQTVSYAYYLPATSPTRYGLPGSPNGTLWVRTITEPAGVDYHSLPQPNAQFQNITWKIDPERVEYEFYIVMIYMPDIQGPGTGIAVDSQLRQAGPDPTQWTCPYSNFYEPNTNNVSSSWSNGCYGWLISALRNKRNDCYTYNRLGNVKTHSVSGFAGVEEYQYYGVEYYFQKQSYKDMEGHTSTFGYGSKVDANPGNRGSVLWAKDAYNNQFTYEYNTYGQKTKETNPNGVVTNYIYGDAWGNLTQVVQDTGAGGLNRTTTMVYDVAGRVISKIDPAGNETTIEYNNLGQPVEVESPDETITYTYGDNGRLVRVTDDHGTTTMGYEYGCDKVQTVEDSSGTITYTHHRDGRMREKILPNGDKWVYGYDPSPNQYALSGGSNYWGGSTIWIQPKDDPNSLTSVPMSVGYCRAGASQADEDSRVYYAIDGVGNIQWIAFNQKFDEYHNLIGFARTEYVYEKATYGFGNYIHRGTLEKIANTYKWIDEQWQWQQKTLNKNEYTYDKNCNRLTNIITDHNQTVRTETYGYDNLSRLTSVNYGDGQTQNYKKVDGSPGFDPMGNRLRKVDNVTGTEDYTYNDANMLMSRTQGTDSYSYIYDGNNNDITNGNTTHVYKNGILDRHNVWDSQNRLAQCVYNGKKSIFTYGSDGLRRKAEVRDAGNNNLISTTDYVLDGQSVARDIVVEGSTTTTRTYHPGIHGPLNCRKHVEGQDPSTDTTRWYIYDGLGSVVGEVDKDGNVTASSKYDVYGGVRTGGTGTATTNHGFVGSLGHTSEAETGLIYMRARYMDPAAGRFISEDPVCSGVNWYAYCGNNPVNRADADGKKWVEKWYAYCNNDWNCVSFYLGACAFVLGVVSLIASKISAVCEANAIAAAAACLPYLAVLAHAEAGFYAGLGFTTAVAALMLGAAGTIVGVLGADTVELGFVDVVDAYIDTASSVATAFGLF